MKTIKVYDPRTNISTDMTYTLLSEMSGLKYENLASLRSRGKRVAPLNVYILKDDTTLKQRKEWYVKQKYEAETWVPIEGSEGKFLISTYGRVKRVYKKKEGFLLPYPNRFGYLRVKVQFKGFYGEYLISSMVAHHFLEPPAPGEVLRHKNGIKADDFVGNLTYMSKKKLGKITGPTSRSKGVVQLDAEQASS